MKDDVKRDRNLQTVSHGFPKGQVLKRPHGFVTPIQNHCLSAEKKVSHLILLSPFNPHLTLVPIASVTATYQAFPHNMPPSSNTVSKLV